jgi:hypothetical protein
MRPSVPPISVGKERLALTACMPKLVVALDVMLLTSTAWKQA